MSDYEISKESIKRFVAHWIWVYQYYKTVLLMYLFYKWQSLYKQLKIKQNGKFR
jgi:hypothetical protein